MAGTNAVPAKRALIDALRHAPGLDGDVQVEYGWPGKRFEREAVWAGKATWSHEPAGSGDRLSRDELLTVELHIRVDVPGGTVEESDARAQTIIAAIEDYLADHRTGEVLAVAGLMRMRVIGGELENGFDDDGAISVGILRVIFASHLR